MMKKPTDVSAVAPASRLIVNEPAAGTTFFIIAVASFVRTVANTMEEVVQSELVTTSAVAPIAKLTVPLGLFIVCGPVVPAVGSLIVNGVLVEEGDGVAVSDESVLEFKALTDLLVDAYKNRPRR